jgi:CHAT domain-containing protein/predicted negative regulator of RcsB-dependent stress response
MRNRALPLAALLWTLAVPAAADDDLARRFAALLTGDDTRALRELAAESADVATAWLPVVDIMNRYDCITVDAVVSEVVRADANERVVRVTVHGGGVTDGPVRVSEPLPNVWILRARPSADGWRVAEVMTREQQVAQQILEARSDDERRALLDPSLDLSRVAIFLAWHSAEAEHGDAGMAMIRFARDIVAAIGDHNRVEYTRQLESTLNTMLGRNDEAIRTAHESIQNCQAVCDADTISNAHFTAGVAYWASEQLVLAVEHFRRAAADVERMKDPRRAVRAWVNAGHLEQSRGRLNNALAAADLAERISRQYGFFEGQLDALAMQDLLYLELGNLAVSHESARKAYQLAMKLQRHERLAMARINLARHLRYHGRTGEALDLLRAVPAESAYLNSARIQIAEILLERGERAEVREIYERVSRDAIAENKPAYAAAAKVELSHLAQRDDPQLALTLAREAIALYSNPGTDQSRMVISEWRLKAAEGSALLALGRDGEAEAAFEEALAKIESARETVAFAPATHMNYLKTRIGVYHHLLELRLRGGRVEDAVRLSERLKGALLDVIRGAETADITSLLTDEERAEQKAVEEEIVRLNGELFGARLDAGRAETVKARLQDARARWEKLEAALHVRHDVRRARSAIDPLQSPGQLLPSAADAILDYVVTPEKTTLFVLTRGDDARLNIGVHTIDADEARLARDVNRFLDRLGAGSFDYEEDARRLHRLLLAPAAKALQGRKTVAIVGDGPLWRLPFQALQGSDGKPLITRFTIFYAPSLASLLRVPGRPAGQKPAVLAIGNPRFSDDVAARVASRTRSALGDLPDAAVEARQVAALYDRSRSRVLTSRQATERAVKENAAHFDVLHIAAHAVADDDQPLYSGIVLARASGEDGLLEGREITRLALHARLAVLSACSTAQGQVRPGEGLIGLSWAFLVAGCPTIVASQWRVPSESTARLMVEFHRELASGEKSVAESLRQAQLALMKDRRYRHPFYWSAFVVVGAGRS